MQVQMHWNRVRGSVTRLSSPDSRSHGRLASAVVDVVAAAAAAAPFLPFLERQCPVLVRAAHLCSDCVD